MSSCTPAGAMTSFQDSARTVGSGLPHGGPRRRSAGCCLANDATFAPRDCCAPMETDAHHGPNGMFTVARGSRASASSGQLAFRPTARRCRTGVRDWTAIQSETQPCNQPRQSIAVQAARTAAKEAAVEGFVGILRAESLGS
jgi:hypothetical protein